MNTVRMITQRHTVTAEHVHADEVRSSPLIKQANVCQLFEPNTPLKLRLMTTTDRCVSTLSPGHSSCWTGALARISACEQMELYSEREAAFSVNPAACTALEDVLRDWHNTLVFTVMLQPQTNACSS